MAINICSGFRRIEMEGKWEEIALSLRFLEITAEEIKYFYEEHLRRFMEAEQLAQGNYSLIIVLKSV